MGKSSPDSQWRHRVQRQQQIALWQQRLWFIKQQQLLQQQRRQQQIQKQRLMPHHQPPAPGLGAEEHNIRRKSAGGAGGGEGDPPTYGEAISSGPSANAAGDRTDLNQADYHSHYSDSLQQRHPTMQWLRLKARERILQRQWNTNGAIRDSLEMQREQLRQMQQRQNEKPSQQNEPQRQDQGREHQPHQVTPHAHEKNLQGGDIYGEKGIDPVSNGTFRDGGCPTAINGWLQRKRSRGEDKDPEGKTTTPPAAVTQSKDPEQSRNRESSPPSSSSSPSAVSATHIPLFISAAAMSTMRSTRNGSMT